MMKDDRKKLLVLGGSKHMVDAVKTVRAMGMSPIVVDDILSGPAKEYADKSFAVNPANAVVLKAVAEKEKVIGIFSVFEDINTWHAIALSKKADLPFYAPFVYCGKVSDKAGFEEICSRFKVSVIRLSGQVYVFNKQVPVLLD